MGMEGHEWEGEACVSRLCMCGSSKIQILKCPGVHVYTLYLHAMILSYIKH